MRRLEFDMLMLKRSTMYPLIEWVFSRELPTHPKFKHFGIEDYEDARRFLITIIEKGTEK